MKWLSIESAPKDENILLLIDNCAIQGCWEDWAEQFRPITLEVHGCGCCGGMSEEATHWMHLPEDPDNPCTEIDLEQGLYPGGRK